jgi:uncharacterized membrane protein
MRRATAAVAALGLGIAAYLTVVRYTGAAPACAIAHGCEVVQHSEYATLAGVPVALLGLLGYAAILLSLLWDGERARSITALLALTGAGFSAWLTYVEVARLDAICSWCVASAVCMALLAGLATARVLSAPAAPPGAPAAEQQATSRSRSRNPNRSQDRRSPRARRA